MFKLKMTYGSPDSAINCRRRAFNTKPLFYRVRVFIMAAIYLRLTPYNYLRKIFLMKGCKDGANDSEQGRSASD